MRPKERRERIVAIVTEQTRASVEALAQMLDASRETVRRDLTLLAEQGLVRKVHGGALRHGGASEDPFAERMQKNSAAKVRIGAAAAALFKPGDTLLVDTGSTTIHFAEALKEKQGLTVITNSQKVAHIISRAGRSEAYLLGGRYAPDNEQVVGPLTVEQVQRFSARHAVLTVGAVDVSGRFMDYNAEEAYVARSMIESAETVTVLVDSSKFETSALFEVCEASRISRLVTDAPLPPAIASALAAASLEVIVAPGLD